MIEPSEAERPKDKEDVTPVDAKADGEAVAAGREETTAAIRANLTKEHINVPREPIREANLRELRESLFKRKEVQDLSALDGAVLGARGKKDGAAVEHAVSGYIKSTELVSTVFLKDAEAECTAAEIDLPKLRVLIQMGYSYAVALANGTHKNPGALNAMKEWQASVAARHPEAIGQLVETYKETIDAEVADSKPDLIMMRQWITLCSGFAPGLATELEGKFQEAIPRRCEYFISRVEAEFAKEKPDMTVIWQNISVPANYYNLLAPGSPIPDRVKALQERFDALEKK
jgi:hypothetical protein